MRLGSLGKIAVLGVRTATGVYFVVRLLTVRHE